MHWQGLRGVQLAVKRSSYQAEDPLPATRAEEVIDHPDSAEAVRKRVGQSRVTWLAACRSAAGRSCTRFSRLARISYTPPFPGGPSLKRNRGRNQCCCHVLRP